MTTVGDVEVTHPVGRAQSMFMGFIGSYIWALKPVGEFGRPIGQAIISNTDGDLILLSVNPNDPPPPKKGTLRGY